MQCACPDCQLLMSLVQKGVESHCKCPECGYKCDACLGTDSVLSVEMIKNYAVYMGIVDDDNTIKTEDK